jgi:hypothetical protein
MQSEAPASAAAELIVDPYGMCPSGPFKHFEKQRSMVGPRLDEPYHEANRVLTLSGVLHIMIILQFKNKTCIIVKESHS